MSGQQSFYIVDDNDIQSIDYETRNLWFPLLVKDDQAYQGTVTSGIAGAKASMKFQGTAVGVVGIVSSVPNVGPPAAQFSIDGKIIQTTVAPNNASQDTQFDYFAFKGLDGSSIHEIEINVLNATTDYPFVMDYMIYLPTEGVTPTGSQAAVTTSLPSITAAPVNNAADTKSSGAPVGAIVGGVIGGVALIVATCIAIWFLCFRRRRSNGQPYFYASSANAGDLLESETKPTPFDVHPQSVAAASTLAPGSAYQPVPQTPSAYSAPPSQYSAPSGLGYSAHTPSERPMSDYGSSVSGPSQGHSLALASGSMPRATTSPNQPRSKAAEAGLLSVPQQSMYHADSGIRFDENGQPIPQASSSSSAPVPDAPDLGDVPPTYSAT
ncbi:hypothetical protein C8Q80DRAFT_1268302 [Daedaleopsis nitida]|nr:hypothetical protein C8Q80DRAFT_1268302 [Daedaleopsis nitida]